ncbi:MAG TPA: circadian clock protein KaiA [Cyanobacteria bacterium UBA11369]|nr:circadian clock protein KaiA [Cyanobacteria bacterium UBA11371]HBE34960.1 circadian clock protein KaiA [Cyanobacteria bacterium UBA11368]HBE48171.1 circadian clock protein KaiA [Cyanobacteria bacterium UBA11369]
MRSRLSIFTYLRSELLAQSLSQYLSSDRYVLTQIYSQQEFLRKVEQEHQLPDCLILQDDPQLLPLLTQLYQQGTLLPLVIVKISLEVKDSSLILDPNPTSIAANSISEDASLFYQNAAVRISITQLSEIPRYIDRAITLFLELSPRVPFSDPSSMSDDTIEVKTQTFLQEQQHRLAEKLRERLGYLGVYYKRNPQNFFRNLSSEQKHEFLDRLKADYREIVLTYFSKDDRLNQKIDEFVNQAFFCDIAVTQIVEIHMELMDDLSKQLKLEGRSDEILLDYRLTLIDVIAHLCEMYRRSIPRDS